MSLRTNTHEQLGSLPGTSTIPGATGPPTLASLQTGHQQIRGFATPRKPRSPQPPGGSHLYPHAPTVSSALALASGSNSVSLSTPRGPHKVIYSPFKSIAGGGRAYNAGIPVVSPSAIPFAPGTPPWPPQPPDSSRLPKIMGDQKKAVDGGGSSLPKKGPSIVASDSDTNDSALKRISKLRATQAQESAVDILRNIPSDGLNLIMNEFDKAQRNKEKIGVHEFVKIMKRYVPYKNHKDKVIDLLCELFTELDTDEDDTIVWTDLVNYLVDIGVQIRDVHDGDGIKRTWAKTAFTSESQHRGHIEKLYYFPGFRCIFSLEKQNTINIYDAENLTLVRELEGQSENSQFVSAEYVPDFGLLSASSTNNIITFWEISSFQPRRKIKTTYAQTSLCWDNKHKLLFSGSTHGAIHGWNIETLEDQTVLFGHKDAITDIVYDYGLDLIMSGSMDSAVKIWDPVTATEKTHLVGHTKGVTSLAFSRSHNLLLSSGFEQDVFVWNPFINKCVARMRGHLSSVMAVRSVLNTPQIISADREGFIKVWDIRNFGCLESFQISGNREITSLCVVSPKSLACGGLSKIMLYEYKESDYSINSDSHPVNVVLYNNSAANFITANGQDIKVWDAKTGKLIRSHRNIMSFEISSMCFDSRDRRLFIADTRGNIKSFNFNSGQVLRELNKHNSDVQYLLYIPDMKALLSASLEKPSVVKLQCDIDENRSSTVKTLQGQDGPLISLTFSPSYYLLATASPDHRIFVWDLQKGTNEGVITVDTEITVIEYMKSCPMLLCADNRGFISLYTTFPSSMKNTPLLRFQNSPENPFSVVKIQYHESTQRLYTVDEVSNLRVWYIPFLEMAKQSNQTQATTVHQYSRSLMPPPEFMGSSLQTSSARKWQELFHRLQTAGTEFLLRQINMLCMWSVSNESILSITHIDEPASIICLSYGGDIEIFSTEGRSLGKLSETLDEEENPWLFIVGRSRRAESQERSSKFAKSVRDDIQKKDVRFDLPSAPLKTPFLALGLSNKFRKSSKALMRRKSDGLFLSFEDWDDGSTPRQGNDN